MNISQLKALLQEVENPKVEFKSKWYCNTDQLDDKGWGEFLKDLVSLANGNIGYTEQNGYLIVGASDTDPNVGELRDTFHVESCGMLSNLQKLREITLRKLREICSPPLSDIKIYFLEVEESKNLLAIEIPAPIDVLKLDRDLNTRGMRFKKGTVLIRVGQDISVADPTEISILKQEYCQKYQKLEEVVQQVIHNLPQPDYIKFVGRKNEIEQLRGLLHPQDRVWTVVIDGIGGIGKSTLALELAHRYLKEYNYLPSPERFEAIIWISAKTSILTADGVKSRYQFTNTIRDIYKEISLVLGEDGIHRHDSLEQNLLIKRVLTKQRTLLIIDNYETIDDELVNSFIRELPYPTKCIVTTRHRIDIADPIRLSAMPREDALFLIRQECQKKHVHLTDNQIELLYRRTAGIPLAVVWSISQVSHHGFGIERVLRCLGDAKGDIAKFCFESAVEGLKETPAYKLLICISLALNPLRSSLSRNELGFIADLSELDRDEGLVTLEKLSLANKDSRQFKVLPLVREYIISHIPSFNINELKEIIIRIAKNYAPSGGDAISLVEQFLANEIINELKEDVTKIVVDQMWEWDGWYDDQGVAYCMSTLEKLATEQAISNLKSIATSSTISYHYTDIGGWIYTWAITSLTRLGRIKEVIEIALTDESISYIIVDSLKKFDFIEVSTEIDVISNSLTEEVAIKLLNQLKDRVLS